MRLLDRNSVDYNRRLRYSGVANESMDATYECRPHGRLAHDAWRDPNCFCWTADKPTPDLMGVLAQAEKEIQVSIDTATPVAPLRARVLAYALEHGNVRTGTVAEALDCNVEQAGYHLRQLALAGELRAEGKSSGRRYLAPSDETPVPPDDDPFVAVIGMFDGQIAELDARRAKLVAARDAVLAVAA